MLFSTTTVFLHAGGHPAAQDAKASPGYRFQSGGWTYVHLEGSPSQIGYQHGRLLASEIADIVEVLKIESEHSTRRDWNFYRDVSREQLWPHIDAEYQQELQGIAKGVQSAGIKLDVWDIVALNGGIELPEYYMPWLNNTDHDVLAEFYLLYRTHLFQQTGHIVLRPLPLVPAEGVALQSDVDVRALAARGPEHDGLEADRPLPVRRMLEDVVALGMGKAAVAYRRPSGEGGQEGEGGGDGAPHFFL